MTMLIASTLSPVMSPMMRTYQVKGHQDKYLLFYEHAQNQVILFHKQHPDSHSPGLASAFQLGVNEEIQEFSGVLQKALGDICMFNKQSLTTSQIHDFRDGEQLLRLRVFSDNTIAIDGPGILPSPTGNTFRIHCSIWLEIQSDVRKMWKHNKTLKDLGNWRRELLYAPPQANNPSGYFRNTSNNHHGSLADTLLQPRPTL